MPGTLDNSWRLYLMLDLFAEQTDWCTFYSNLSLCLNMTCQRFTNQNIIVYAMAFKWHVNICRSCYCSLPSTAGLSQYRGRGRDRERKTEQPYSDYRDRQISPALAAQREPYLSILSPWISVCVCACENLRVCVCERVSIICASVCVCVCV